MLAKLKGKRGFTLVELMIVVAIIGVLAALAIYGVRKYISNAKTAEARMTLGRIAKDASASYNRENMNAAVIAPGASAGISNLLCGSATATVPAAIARVTGMKYQSSVADWRNAGDSATVGWTCLRFSMQDPQYYMYNYTRDADTLGFAGIATGDLNGDTVTSTFQIVGRVVNSVVNVAPTISETNPDE